MARAHRVVLAVTLACGALVGPPAQAQAQALDLGEFQCRVVLNLSGNGVTSCRGSTVGTRSAYMSVNVSYQHTACPLIGTASGTVDLSSYPFGPFTLYSNIDYTRVGATAVFVLSGAHTGAAVAVFVPDLDDVVADTGFICSDPSVGITLIGVFAAI